MKQGKISVLTILTAVFGVLLVGIGVAFNNCAGLGNDSIGIVYDGIRNAFGMTAEQLGRASNVVNISLILVLLAIGKRYISLGTFVYLLPYGVCVDIGTKLYGVIHFSEGMLNSILFSVTGCILLYIGVALYITVDIGVDPFTGIVLVLVDKLKKEFRFVKIIFDITMILIGLILEGKAGMVTAVTALTAGPCIQFFHKKFVKILVKKSREE